MKIEKITSNQNRDHSPLNKKLVSILALGWRPFQKKRIPSSRININLYPDQFCNVSKSSLEHLNKLLKMHHSF